MNLEQKKQKHRDFWDSDSGSLIFIPAASMCQYDVVDYDKRFNDPAKMLEAELRRAEAVVNWHTDGIPTVRPNLGIIFIPAIAGQDYRVIDGQMPWVGDHLSVEKIKQISSVDIDASIMLKLATEFYCQFKKNDSLEIAAYHPDTQGVFDILHLLRGDELFYELSDEEGVIQTHRLLEIVTELYIDVSKSVKGFLCEKPNEMIHGHGTPQGLYFPHAGTRLSEDTPTLLSPSMIDEFVLPYMQKATEPFGGAFVHFCGKHDYLYETILECEFVKAIDLGNPEMYNTEWLLKKCSKTNTVFYGKIADENGESWRDYVIRIAELIQETDAKCVLRPTIFPTEKKECEEMYYLWHHLTSW